MKIHVGDYKRASHIKNGDEYKKLYPDDKTFSNAFEFHKMPSRNLLKKSDSCYLNLKWLWGINRII